MEMTNNLLAYQTRLKERGMSPQTISFYTADYALFLRYCSKHQQHLDELTDQSLRDFFLWYEQDRGSRAVLKRSFTALKKAYDLKLLPNTISFFQKPLNDLPVLRAVLKKIKTVPDKQRMQIILAHLYVAGCNMSHLRSLKRHDINFDQKCLTTHRKTLPISEECHTLLAQQSAQTDYDHDYLFVTKKENQIALLSHQAVWRLIRTLYPKSASELLQLKHIIEEQSEQHVVDSSLHEVYQSAHPRN